MKANASGEIPVLVTFCGERIYVNVRWEGYRDEFGEPEIYTTEAIIECIDNNEKGNAKVDLKLHQIHRELDILPLLSVDDTDSVYDAVDSDARYGC